MNRLPTLVRKATQCRLHRTVYLCFFMYSVSHANAQIYQPGSIVLGKTTAEHAADAFNWGISSLEGTHAADLTSERIYENQSGPVFFLPVNCLCWTSMDYAEIDVPFGAPMGLGLPAYVAWDHGADGNRNLARNNYPPPRSRSLTVDGVSIPIGRLDYIEETPIFIVNREKSGILPGRTDPYEGYIKGPFMMFEPMEPGHHLIEFSLDASYASYSVSLPINVVMPEVASLSLGEIYSQDFDSLGTAGDTVKSPLPTAWTVTDEWGFVLQTDTDAEFPISTRPRPGAFPYVTNAGIPGEEDRALSIYMPRDTESRSLESDVSQLQFLASTNGAAQSLQIQFDIEAWDASTSTTASSPGEAAFDVTIDIDSGNGFQPLLDLGRVTTGELQKPTGDYLNGNEAANRISFDSGVVPAAIPDGSKLRLRWSTDLDANSDGWVFGIDNFAITLLGNVGGLAGDFNGDGLLDINDLNTLSTAIQTNTLDTQYDLDGSGVVDLADRQYWVSDVKKTWLGDTNLDNVFDSGDMIAVFLAGEYEDSLDGNSTWATGDWNGDGDFNSGDMISAFLDGGYEAGPRASVSAVPEPSAILLTAIALLGLVRLRAR